MLIACIGGYIGYSNYQDYLVQKNLEEHFGNVHLSDDEVDEIANSILELDSTNDDSLDIDANFQIEKKGSIEDTAEPESYVYDIQSILNDEQFLQALTLAAYTLQCNLTEITDVKGEEPTLGLPNISVYASTDICNLKISLMQYESGKWDCYMIVNADSGHIYYSPDVASNYLDIYDYKTDELIKPKQTDSSTSSDE